MHLGRTHSFLLIHLPTPTRFQKTTARDSTQLALRPDAISSHHPECALKLGPRRERHGSNPDNAPVVILLFDNWWGHGCSEFFQSLDLRNRGDSMTSDEWRSWMSQHQRTRTIAVPFPDDIRRRRVTPSRCPIANR